MRTLKKLTVGLLIFLLFLTLFIFGFLFSVNSTVMNPDFIVQRVHEIDTVQLIDGAFEIETSPETEQTLENVKELMSQVEPVVQERLSIAVYSLYDYLLGDKPDPELKKTLGDSLLNAEFVDSVLAEISLPELIDTILRANEGQEEAPQEFINAVKEVVTDLEPEIKEQLSSVSTPVFDYILGVTDDINLTAVLRDTVLNEDFVVPLIDKLDLSALTEELLTAELTNQIPPEMEFLTDYVASAVQIIEPTIKDELEDAAGPFLDYLLGETQHLSIYISLDLIVETIENNLKEELLATPPPAYSNLSQNELEQLFNETFSGRLSEILPSTFEVDESIIGPEIIGDFSGMIADLEDSLLDVRTGIDDAVLSTEEPLAESRKWISVFQAVYIGIIIFIVLMVLGIILILRDVRAVTRCIGIPLFIYGALEYTGLLVGKYFLNGRLPASGIPEGTENLISDISNSFMRPLEIFSLCLLVVGVILTVVSFIYRREEKELGFQDND